MLPDGTQIWRITHNGVDTHPVHFHLFDVQLINRVGWDGALRPPDDNELGWKDTVRVSPLEDSIVALKPVSPKVPFGVPDSIRPIDPTMPLGSPITYEELGAGNVPQTVTIPNDMFNYAWEYVFHCHILSHEEMDMMRPMTFAVDHELPATPDPFAASGTPGDPVGITLAWTDPTPGRSGLTVESSPETTAEIGLRVEQTALTGGGAEVEWAPVGIAPSNAEPYVDLTTIPGSASPRCWLTARSCPRRRPTRSPTCRLTTRSPQPSAAISSCRSIGSTTW